MLNNPGEGECWMEERREGSQATSVSGRNRATSPGVFFSRRGGRESYWMKGPRLSVPGHRGSESNWQALSTKLGSRRVRWTRPLALRSSAALLSQPAQRRPTRRPCSTPYDTPNRKSSSKHPQISSRKKKLEARSSSRSHPHDLLSLQPTNC